MPILFFRRDLRGLMANGQILQLQRAVSRFHFYAANYSAHPPKRQLIIFMIIDILFLPVLFFIGAIASYQDFYCGKIKNKWIILGLVWGGGVFAVFTTWNLAANFLLDIWRIQLPVILWAYILKVLLNALIALAAGYFLWYFDVWAAGDAKLFFIFALLLPLKYYWRSALPYFPSAVLLINTFIPIIIFLVLLNLYRLWAYVRELDRAGQLRKTFDGLAGQSKVLIKKEKWQIVRVIAGAFLMSFIFQLLRYKFFGMNNGQSNWMIVIFLLMSQSMRYFNMILRSRIGQASVVLAALVCAYWTRAFFAAGDFFEIMRLMKSSLLIMPAFLLIYALLTKMPGGQKKRLLPFALWMFVGVLITMMFKGSIISSVLGPQM